MLEMFFDDKKVFSVFEKILKSQSKRVLMPKILYEEGLTPQEGVDILQSFVFLGILDELEDTRETGIFKFNSDSIVVLGICIFDEIVAKVCFEKTQGMVDNGEIDISDMLKEANQEDVEESIKDFVDFLKQKGLL